MIHSLSFVTLILALLSANKTATRPETGTTEPGKSFYDFKMKAINGKEVDFSAFKGKKVLIVNVASKCGFTPQYEDLQKLHELYQHKVEVLGFPANNFGKQEPGSNQEIAQFCQLNYGVSFQMFEKISVKGNDQHPLYQWLSDKNLNGWNSQAPTWNFCKYLVNEEGELVWVKPKDWTSGFFSGNLWYIYEITGNSKWKGYAQKWTEGLEPQKNNTGTHDLGFMMYCSFGNGYRLTGNKEYKDILITSAKSLSTRYNDTCKAIKSWDWSDEWEYPVIIDNMMNLELLFKATRFTGDSSFYHIADQHATTSMQVHYREDFSCYHVVDFDKNTGDVQWKGTHQGYSDEST